MDPSQRARRWGAVFFLVLLPLAVHAPLWLLGRTSDPLLFVSGLAVRPPQGLLPGQPGWLDPNAGFTTQALGGAAASAWLRGEVPWWNPDAGVGMPLAAETQPAALFLPFTLLLALKQGVLANKIALQMLAGLATYGLLRELRLGRRVALLGGALFALNGTFAWFSHAAINPLPFLPLLLLGIERTASARRGGWAWIAVAIAYAQYAGFPEVAFLDGLLALAWAGWRFAATGGPARWRFAGKLALGGALGLLLAAPATLPFLDLLGSSDLGGHTVIGDAPMEPSGWAQILLPYLEGPLGSTPEWYLVGGSIGLPVLLLGLVALWRRGRDAGLRVVLAGCIVLFAAKAAQLPGLAPLFDLIPFVQQSACYLYAVPACEMAALVLAAFTLDDWMCGRLPGRRAVLGAGVLALLLLGWALWLARTVMLRLLPTGRLHELYAAGSLAVALGVTLAVAWLLWRPPGRWRGAALGAVLALDAAAVFALPLLSATRPVPVELGWSRFLREHLGMSRFYALGAPAPNYPTWYGLAAINHQALPVPRAWVDYIHTHLDPGADGVSFTGAEPAARPGQESRAVALVRRLAAYQAVGVKYLLAPAGNSPFATPIDLRIALADGPPILLKLSLHESLFGGLPSARVPAGLAASVTVDVARGTGTAGGAVRLDICSPRVCTFGIAPVPPEAGGIPLTVPLLPPLELNGGDEVRYLLTRSEGDAPITVPLLPVPEGGAEAAMVQLRTPQGEIAGRSPYLTVRFAPADAPPRVFRDRLFDIYELPAPAPYLEALGTACTLTPASRRAVTADCAGAATLLRRELFDPGWQAEVNGARAEVTRAEEIFQSVALPPGRSQVRFGYAPPSIGVAYAAAALGLAGLAVGLLRRRRG